MQDLAGKTAFITGGASGLGLAMAHSLCATVLLATGMQVMVRVRGERPAAVVQGVPATR